MKWGAGGVNTPLLFWFLLDGDPPPCSHTRRAARPAAGGAVVALCVLVRYVMWCGGDGSGLARSSAAWGSAGGVVAFTWDGGVAHGAWVSGGALGVVCVWV